MFSIRFWKLTITARFNSWGRDRFWRSDHLTATQEAVDADPNLPFLDAVKTTVIRDSRWRCDHGWDN